MSKSYGGLLAGRHPELPEMEAVVRREDDVGVGELTGAAQRADQLPDAGVDGDERLDPALVQGVAAPLNGRGHMRQLAYERGLPCDARRVVRGRARRTRAEEAHGIARRRRRRLMRRVYREVREERPAGGDGPGDELLRRANVHVGPVVPRGVAVAPEPAVLVQRVVELGVRIAARRAVELGPTRRDVRRVVGAGIPVEVLAHERGAVPAGGEPRGDRRPLDAQAVRGPEAAVAARVGLHSGVVRVLPA